MADAPRTPTTPVFRTWRYQDAVAALGAMQAPAGGKDAFAETLAFAETGDHWQDGKAWPVANGLNAAIRLKILDQVAPQFRPLDIIGEVLDNVANGLLDQEPDVSFAPRVPPKDPQSEEATRLAEESERMVAAISGWWDRVQFWESCRKAVRRSRWATFAALRAWIAPGAMVTTEGENGTRTTMLPTTLTFDAALAAVQLTAPAPTAGFIYTDPDTQARCAVFFYETAKTQDAPAKKAVELWFVDGDGDAAQTILRVVQEGGDATSAQEFPVPLGGRLPMAQMIADLLITDPVRRQQKTLNYFSTLLVRIVEAAGFPERYTLNAKPSGVWLATPPTDGPSLEVIEVDGTKWYLHPAPRQLGPMVTTDLRGIVVSKSDTNGGEMIATPGVEFKEPTDPDYLIRTCEHGRTTILRACKQAHSATESTAESSGLAYQQARAVFGKDLKATKAPLEGMIRNIIESVIALAEHLSGVTPASSFLARFRCVVNLHVDPGPASPLEMAEYREQNKAGLLSRESAMARGGVEDTSAEITALATDPIALANLRLIQGQAMAALQQGGAGFMGSARALGISEEDAKSWMASDTDRLDVTP